MNLNERAARLCDQLVEQAVRLQIDANLTIGGARVIDLGISAAGGVDAGLMLARICLADLAQVNLFPAASGTAWPIVSVSTKQPVLACLASQYAGWQLVAGKFFALGSGPMRAVAGREPLFETIGYRERASQVVGVLETRQLPPPELVQQIAEACRVEPAGVTLLVAPTASPAGTLQIVARSVETALHKLHELDFDVARIVRGRGTAPLLPVAKNDLAAIGYTNDAILYGAEVTLSVRGDDASLAQIGPRVPSCASADFGAPFSEIFERYQRRFYDIDPLLFSPAVIVFENMDTGRVHRFGKLMPEVLHQSCAT